MKGCSVLGLYEDARFSPRSFANLENVHTKFEEYPDYKTALLWISRFVLRDHAMMGRDGAICPRLQPAVSKNLLNFVSVQTTVGTVAEAIVTLPLLGDLFEESVKIEPSFQRGSLLAFFPGLADRHVANFIDLGHKKLRLHFVSRGLMLGEFHPFSEVGSVWNDELRVLRSPVPMLAVRALSVHDLVFLDRSDVNTPDRISYLRHYRNYLGPRLKLNELDRLSQRIDDLVSESR